MFRVRAVLFLLIVVATLMIYGPLIALLYPLPARYTFLAGTHWCRFFLWCCRVIAGLDLRLTGLENMPAEPCVMICKHQSQWETLAFMALFPPYVWIVKREVLWIPFLGWGVAGLRSIAIDRSAGHSAVEQIRDQGLERLAEGLNVLIFPEGTRMAPGRNRRFGMGGAVLATTAGVKAVPIAHNAGLFWPPRSWLIQRPGTIDIEVGPAIEAANVSPETLNGQLKTWMDSTVNRLEAPYLNDPKA